MSPHQDKFNKGFTLVEVLVALALLTVGLVPAFFQATNALTLSTAIKNSLVSADLAQEGVEVVRAIRDANWFAGGAFDNGLDGCSSGCRVQWNSDAVLPLAGNPPLKRNDTSGLYQYDAGFDTDFSREIIITQISAVELQVVSTVTWKERGQDKSFSVESHLFDWATP